MVRDGRGNIYVAANPAGQRRIDRKGNGCVVASGLDMASAVGSATAKRNFKRRNLYVVDFHGRVMSFGTAPARGPAGPKHL